MVAARKELELVPKKRYVVRQLKYYLDIGKYPLWKRLYFYYVWMPFARFTCHKLKLPVVNRIDTDGNLAWEELQAVCTDRELADEMIRGKKWWSHVPLYENVCLPADTCAVGDLVNSGANARDANVRANWPMVAVPRTLIDEAARVINRTRRDAT